jgi:hypothetical protein
LEEIWRGDLPEERRRALWETHMKKFTISAGLPGLETLPEETRREIWEWLSDVLDRADRPD